MSRGSLHLDIEEITEPSQDRLGVWYASEWRDGKLLWYFAFESEGEAVKALGARE